jgi:hypothetical protein
MSAGVVGAAQMIVLRLGTLLFGAPEPSAEKALAAIRDLKRLEFLLDRLTKHELKSWDEVVQE